MFCIVLLDMEESDDELTVSWLAVVFRSKLVLREALPYLLGEALPPIADDVRGGKSCPSPRTASPLSRLLVDRLLDCLAGTSVGSPPAVLATLPCRVLPMLLMLPFSLPFLCRNLCCFRFKPWSRFMMISLIRGRNRSRLACEASWLSVSSRIARRSSGTGPRSPVSTPIALKALHAILNSYPNRT